MTSIEHWSGIPDDLRDGEREPTLNGGFEIPDVESMSISERAEKGLGPAIKRGPGRDPETIAKTLEEPTDREAAGMDKLDDVDIQILQHKLDSIVDEGRFVYERLAMGAANRMGDLCTAIFTAKGDMCSISTGVYFHAILNYAPIKYIRKHFVGDPTVEVEPGDIFFYNEALSGTVHPYDMFTAMPVFHDDELVAWVVTGGHQGEAGAKGPAGFTPDAKTRYEEGFHAPPFKLGEDFEVSTDLMDFLANSVRNPRTLTMDQKTRVSACMRMRERLLEEMSNRSVEEVVGGMRRILDRDVEMARERIQEFNDGVYRHVTFLDTIGTDDGLVRIPVELRKKDDQIMIDMSGASPQHLQGPWHTFWHFVRGALAAFMFPYLFSRLHMSMGLMEPVTLKVPPGTLYNTTDESVAHGQATFMGRMVTITAAQAAMKMLYDSDYSDRVATTMAKSGHHAQYTMAGTDQYGHEWSTSAPEVNAAGGGARHNMDGVDAQGFFWSPVVDCMGVEEVERRFPLLYLFYEVQQSERHGYGKYRGGQGVAAAVTPHHTEKGGTVRSSNVGMGERFSFEFGLFGGYPGPTTPRIEVSDSNINELLASTSDDIPTNFEELAEGELLDGTTQTVSQTAPVTEYSSDDVAGIWVSSGGGYGDVLERDPDRVMEDIERGVLSHESAQEIYRIAYDSETLSIDESETEQQREEAREERLEDPRTKPFDEFYAEWGEKKPDDELLEYYGEWPIPDTGSTAGSY